MNNGKWILEETSSINDETESTYLKIVFQAINSVNSKEVAYYNDEEWSKVYERNFIINMSYRLGSIMSKNQVSREILVNGEVLKELSLSDKECEVVKQVNPQKTIIKNGKSSLVQVYPDFVIHSLHDPKCSADSQILILEAKAGKISSGNHFFWDLIKLKYYLAHLCFKTAVYLLVGNNKETVEGYMNSFIEMLGDDITIYKKRLYFIIKDIDEISKAHIYQMAYCNS